MSLTRSIHPVQTAGGPGNTGPRGLANPGAYVSGRYYSGYYAAEGINAALLVNGVTHFTPFYVSDSVTAARLLVATHSANAATAGSVVRLGIYTSNNYKPDAVFADGGTVATTAVGAYATVTISANLTPDQMFWFAVTQQGAPATAATLVVYRAPLWLGEQDPTTGIGLAEYTATGITGAYANGPTLIKGTARTPLVAFRAA